MSPEPQPRHLKKKKKKKKPMMLLLWTDLLLLVGRSLGIFVLAVCFLIAGCYDILERNIDTKAGLYEMPQATIEITSSEMV
jgi:hypothetical protein